MADEPRWRRLVVLSLAWRNLTAERRRWLVSTLAIAVAVGLMLFSQGVVRWVEQSATDYLAHLPTRLVVTQTGVNDFLLSQSTVPHSSYLRLRALPGAMATPILTVNGVLARTSHPLPIMIIGYPPNAGGGPWALDAGRYPRASDEAVVDRGLANVNGIALGSTISLFGHHLRVVGLSADTNAAGIFLIFSPLATVQQLVGKPAVSYVLLRGRQRGLETKLAHDVARLPGVQLVTLPRLIANDRHMIQAGFSQPVEVLVAISLIVGLLITTMVLYTTTVEHVRDFALLKAIGTRPTIVWLVAVAQAFILSLTGFLLGWGLASALTAAIRSFYPVIDSYLQPGVLMEIAALVVVVSLIALVLPLRFLRRVDPQEVFKA